MLYVRRYVYIKNERHIERKLTMQKLTIDYERCKHCGFCVRTCNKQALYFGEKLNSTSYIVVESDTEKCVLCGMCYTVCPDGVFEIVETTEVNA